MSDIPESSTKPKPFVFVVMPFASEFNDVYQLGIKAACVEAGAYCERLDEQVFEEGMLDRIYNQIAKADIIVADMSAQNPNVFYEVGYAHALGKRVVLITKKAADIPFDLKHRFHIIYEEGIAALKAKLFSRIAWFVGHPHEAKTSELDSLEFYVDGTALSQPVQIVQKNRTYDMHGTSGCLLTVSAHNPWNPKRGLAKFHASLLTSTIFPSCFAGSYSKIDSIKLPAGTVLHQFVDEIEIPPGGYKNIQFPLVSGKRFAPNFGPSAVVLRTLGSGLSRGLSFNIDYQPN